MTAPPVASGPAEPAEAQDVLPGLAAPRTAARGLFPTPLGIASTTPLPAS